MRKNTLKAAITRNSHRIPRRAGINVFALAFFNRCALRPEAQECTSHRKLDAKLTDFGVSQERQEHIMAAGVGTMFRMAPEVKMAEYYDEKVDIFPLQRAAFRARSTDVTMLACET
ncbi:unnamed protein product [Phytophthora fragariaefolia]|uniref:Unnamed protein product n=1 Tax=Phytophthora fragariaefolia TaxID=1490495 RepID=A0A9W6YRD9_9STRA|nr:unnamed protein product [Phytophthora fragariaefolia]